MKKDYKNILIELSKDESKLKDLLDWFIVENKIDIEKISKEEIKTLIKHLETEELDAVEFKKIMKKF